MTPPPRDVLRCPRCRSSIPGEGSSGCSSCKPCSFAVAPDVYDFLGRVTEQDRRILSWSSEGFERLAQSFTETPKRAALRPELRYTLSIDRFSDLAGLTVPLALQLLELWHEEEHVRDNPDFDRFVSLSRLGQESSLLDVGCATGRTLRFVRGLHPKLLAGVDDDPTRIAFGSAWMKSIQQPALLAVGSAYALPFSDGAFSHVVCRNSVTYMHQRQSLAEMSRVLSPGGFLFIRYERWLYDAMQVVRARSNYDRAFRLRDFGCGLLHHVTGLQARPNESRFGGSRAFGSAARITSLLSDGGLTLLETRPGSKCPEFLGRSTQYSLIYQKRQ
jgi:SAM-dependent methyltransferase